MASINATIRQYLIDEALQGESPDDLTDDTNLVEEEILDSLGIFALVEWLEETFHVQIEAEEVVMTNFESIRTIEALVERLTQPAAT
jgi:acyl carrier protein